MEHIFALFGTTAEMARALDEGYQTVASWRRRGSIPAKHDKKIISAAKRRGKRLTYEDLAEARSVIVKRSETEARASAA